MHPFTCASYRVVPTTHGGGDPQAFQLIRLLRQGRAHSEGTGMASSPILLLLLLLKTLLLLPLLSSLTTALSLKPCNSADKRALLQLKKALGDPHTLKSWTADTDCCKDWSSMGCEFSSGRVVEIDISHSDAAGPLPPAVGDLPLLLSITVRKSPNVTGPLPPELTKLTKLTDLWMDWNSLTGELPAFLGRMALEVIDLSFNKLSGSIPPTLGSLPRLRALSLSRNQLTGAIPESLGRIREQMLFMDLSHNHLTGPVPLSFKRLFVNDLDLSRNRLTGDPSALLPMFWFRNLNLSRNLFEFDLSKAKLYKYLTSLDLSHNRIYGKIPAQLMNNLPLKFNISYNRLCGEIPQPPGGFFFGKTKYDFFHNRCLCGKPLAPCK